MSSQDKDNGIAAVWRCCGTFTWLFWICLG
jgi:hypothetical protein